MLTRALSFPTLATPPGASRFTQHLSYVLTRAIPISPIYPLLARRCDERRVVALYGGLAATAMLPLLLAGVTGYHGLEFVWLTEWAVVDFLLLIAPLRIAERAISAGDAVDAMADTATSGDFAPCEPWWLPWSTRWMRHDRQALAFLFGLIGAGLTTIPVADALHTHLTLGVIAYAQQAVTGALGASAAYLGLAALDLCRELALINRRQDFRVTWWAPAKTPGIEELSRTFRVSAILSFVIALLFSPPIVWAYLTASRDAALLAAVLFALVGTLALLLSVTWLPHLWLSQVVQREKARIVEALASHVEGLSDPRVGANLRLDAERISVLSIILAMQEADDLTYDLRYMLRATAAVTLSVLPYIVSLAVRL